MTLHCVAIAGLSSYDQTIVNVPWTTVTPGGSFRRNLPAGYYSQLYFNLWGVLFKLPTTSPYCYYFVDGVYNNWVVDACAGASWSDLEGKRLGLFDNHTSSYLKDCKDASDACVATVILTLVTSVIAVLSRGCCRSRFSYEDDKGKKCGMLITTLIPVIVSSASLGSYNEMCITSINDAISNVESGSPLYGTEAVMGAGLTCMIVSLVLNIVSFFLQLLVPGTKTEPLNYKVEG